MITAIFFYLFSFFVVVSVSMQHFKHLNTSHSIYDYNDLLDKINIIYSPVFEAMHSSRTVANIFAKIYFSVGDLDDICILGFLYKTPDRIKYQ